MLDTFSSAMYHLQRWVTEDGLDPDISIQSLKKGGTKMVTKIEDTFEEIPEDIAELTKIGLKFRIEHVNSLHHVEFREPISHTIQQLLDHAYEKLGEAKRPGDKLQTEKGKDLTPFLGHTILQAFIHGELKTRKLEIIGDTGGA